MAVITSLRDPIRSPARSRSNAPGRPRRAKSRPPESMGDFPPLSISLAPVGLGNECEPVSNMANGGKLPRRTGFAIEDLHKRDSRRDDVLQASRLISLPAKFTSGIPKNLCGILRSDEPGTSMAIAATRDLLVVSPRPRMIQRFVPAAAALRGDDFSRNLFGDPSSDFQRPVRLPRPQKALMPPHQYGRSPRSYAFWSPSTRASLRFLRPGHTGVRT